MKSFLILLLSLNLYSSDIEIIDKVNYGDEGNPIYVLVVCIKGIQHLLFETTDELVKDVELNPDGTTLYKTCPTFVNTVDYTNKGLK